jgi:hypothetical protein
MRVSKIYTYVHSSEELHTDTHTYIHITHTHIQKHKAIHPYKLSSAIAVRRDRQATLPTTLSEHTHTHTHTYIHTYIHTIHTYIHTYTLPTTLSEHTCIHTYTYIHTYMHAYIHTYTLPTTLSEHTCIHTYIHTYMHTYIHLAYYAISTYIHTYIHTQSYHTHLHGLRNTTVHTHTHAYRLSSAIAARRDRQPTVPTTVSEEMSLNPYMRVGLYPSGCVSVCLRIYVCDMYKSAVDAILKNTLTHQHVCTPRQKHVGSVEWYSGVCVCVRVHRNATHTSMHGHIHTYTHTCIYKRRRSHPRRRVACLRWQYIQ